MPSVGFESTISAGEWPKTYALDRTATGTGASYIIDNKFTCMDVSHLYESFELILHKCFR